MPIKCGFSACKYNSATEKCTMGTCSCEKDVELRCVDMDSAISSLEPWSEDEMFGYMDRELGGTCVLMCDTYEFDSSKFNSKNKGE